MKKLLLLCALIAFGFSEGSISTVFAESVEILSFIKFTDQKTKISESDLPDEVLTSFSESEYGDWEIIDVFQEEGDGEDMDVYYEINVNGNNEENVSLLYDANGRLVETR